MISPCRWCSSSACRRLPPPVSTTEISVFSLLSSCKTLASLHQIHARIVKEGVVQDHVVATKFLCLCNSLSAPADYASTVFDRIVFPNIYLWNTLLKALADRTSLGVVVFQFRRMMGGSTVRPDSFTFPPLLKSCAAGLALREGMSIHGCAVRVGVDEDLFVRTGLVNMYGKCREIKSARKLFDTMHHKNEVLWTAMIVGYSISGDLSSARWLFDQMPKRNIMSWNSMIHGHVKHGDLKGARMLFDEIPEKNAATFTSLIDGYAKVGDMASARLLFEQLNDKDLFSWSVMISGYVHNGCPEEAVKMFTEMLNRSITPDEFVMVGVMSACARLGNLKLAKWLDIYASQSRIDLSCPHVVTSLIDMNVRCGNMERATVLFESLPARDLITYCSMMQGYSIHGHGGEAVKLFFRMIHEGLMPDETAFTVVLAACSHSGLVQEGYRLFELMKSEYLMVPSPEHYAIMVNLLGRVGQLKEAYELIKFMPVEPHTGAWGALLGACRLHGDINLGGVIAKKLFELEPKSGGNYVLLSNIYADANRWVDVSDVRNMMIEKGIKKISGCSWI